MPDRKKYITDLLLQKWLFTESAAQRATLCAGLALFLGYKTAYAIDVLFSIGALSIALCLKEVEADCQNTEKKGKKSILEKTEKT